ncbi:MAG TPA: hypothetical protein VEJ87_10510 [Acidimicrobiales bacterium]|nr:hypothetical protein [Acidimicrobiales bacterium]
MTRISPDEDHNDAEFLVVWRARNDARDVFETLVGPMRQAARQGIRRMGLVPDEHDVEDVVFTAFKEYLKIAARRQVRCPVQFAKRLANLRGRDRARAIHRAREDIDNSAWVIGELRVPDEDAEATVEREELASQAVECMDRLTSDQRDVIETTILRQMSLSHWASARGKSHQAAGQMRLRGLQALRRCIDAKHAAAADDDEDDKRSRDA